MQFAVSQVTSHVEPPSQRAEQLSPAHRIVQRAPVSQVTELLAPTAASQVELVHRTLELWPAMTVQCEEPSQTTWALLPVDAVHVEASVHDTFVLSPTAISHSEAMQSASEEFPVRTKQRAPLTQAEAHPFEHPATQAGAPSHERRHPVPSVLQFIAVVKPHSVPSRQAHPVSVHEHSAAVHGRSGAALPSHPARNVSATSRDNLIIQAPVLPERTARDTLRF